MDNKLYHINLSKNDIQGAKYAILPGDPDRVPKIAQFFDNPRKLEQTNISKYRRRLHIWDSTCNYR